MLEPALPIAFVDGLNVAVTTRGQIERTLTGGISVVNLTALPYSGDFRAAMAILAQKIKEIDAASDIVAIVRSIRDIGAARASNKLSIVLGGQSSSAVEEDLELLRVLKLIGVRILQPTYMEHNSFGSGVLADRPDAGLSERGREWVSLMNALRMQIDLSHVGYRTAADAIALSKRPVIFSHANPRTLCDSLRNIPDSLIRGAADSGGTVGITPWPPMLRHERAPTLDDWAAHVAYVVNLAGLEHVSFAGDLQETEPGSQAWYNPRAKYPEITNAPADWYLFETRACHGFESYSQFPNLVAALERRGFVDNAIDKIMGGNLLRVFHEVWGE